jgi:hypothetical protein
LDRTELKITIVGKHIKLFRRCGEDQVLKDFENDFEGATAQDNEDQDEDKIVEDY